MRSLVVLLIGAAVGVWAPVAFAQEAPAAPEVTRNEATSGAAVDIAVEEEAPEEQPWTARFMIPAMVALTAVVVVLSAVVYGLRVRARYRVVR